LARRSVAILLVAALAASLSYFPFLKIPLSLGLCLYGALLYAYPILWLIVVPALLPVFDLAPWSGWFFLDEMDFLVLLTLAVGLWKRESKEADGPATPTLLVIALLFLVVSYSVSGWIGLSPLDPLDANAFSNYYSRYNSLRMGKGFAEAIALFLLFLWQGHDKSQAAKCFVIGMVLGVAGTTLAVLWERFRFSGLLDFASEFRVTATFSGLHNGGNDLEAYIALAQPFIIAFIILYRRWMSALAGFVLFILSTYSLFVTFSRAGLLALVVNGIVLAVGLTVSLWHDGGFLSRRALPVGMFLATAVLGLVAVVVGGPYFQSRLEAAKRDWGYRMYQSRKTVAMMTPTSATAWFGMGLGRFPASVYQLNPYNNRPAAYRFELEKTNLFVRLFPGNPLYFGQWIGGIKPFEKYRLRFDARAHGQGVLTIFICEKTLQYSFRCANQPFDLKASDSWAEQQAVIDAELVGGKDELGGWFSLRPVEFALANSAKDAVFDVDNVRLLDAAGNNLLVNGDFSRGSDRWFFTVDDHTPWQNWNHWVHLYFEQGWLGVITFLFFVSYLACRLAKQTINGNWFACISLAALSSFLTVGIFGYLFDTPRMALIYFLIALIFGRGLSAPISVARESAA
jgi:hypothetical protein